METNTHYYKKLKEIKFSFEKLIKETQCDIEVFRNEQQHLQKQIQKIIVENNAINSKLEGLKTMQAGIAPSTIRTAGESKDDATREQITNDAFYNVKKQIDFLQAENNDLRLLNKNYEITINNLENEIQNYRNQLFKPSSVSEIKHKYDTTIKILETAIKHKNSKLESQAQSIETLLEQNKQLTERIEKAEKSLEEKDRELEKFAESAETINKLQEQVTETERLNKELQKSLKLSRQTIEKRFKREQSALQKVQEALHIAEAAVADKEEALKREKVVREECDNIAATVGQVMDEAARKVESDMDAIKNKYIEKEKIFNEEREKLNEEIQNQKSFIQILDTRCKRFQQKYRDAVKDNENLTDQLEQAAKALCELEDKTKKLEYQNVPKVSIDQEKIQKFVENNRLLKERFTSTINDLTDKFKKEIYDLQLEVTRLKAENEVFNLQKNA